VIKHETPAWPELLRSRGWETILMPADGSVIDRCPTCANSIR